METQKFCVYNQTRESFLSLGVIVADTALKQLKALIENLAIKADSGLWLTPFRGIPAARGLSPVDLIFLNEDYRVMQSVESYPNAVYEPLRAQSASALVLPAHTIFSSQTQPGDQLVICVAEEMERRLEYFSNSTGPVPVIRGYESPGELALEIEEPSLYPVADQTIEMQHARHRLDEKENAELEALKNASWFTRFLRWLSTDRRKGKRHPLPGLVAYYWTGSSPQAYHVGDISGSGLYLLTEERWFPGTMILMTLQRTNTEGEDPEDSIAVLTKVARWGNDGVGLSFVPSNTFDLKSGETLPGSGVDKKTLARFIERVKPPSE